MLQIFLVLLLLTGSTLAADPPLPRWDNSALLGAGEPVLPMKGEPVYDNLELGKPVHLIPYQVEGEDWFVLLDREGKVSSLKADGSGAVHLGIDFRTHFGTAPQPNDMCYGAAFDPNYPDVPHLFVLWNDKRGPEARNRLVRLTITNHAPLQLDPASRLDIIDWPSNGHNGSDPQFGPQDGFLYLPTGDGQAPGDPANTGQNTDDLLGSILRIDIAGATADEPYHIPEDNPFVGIDGVRPEVWSYGFRNPWRMVFHPDTHELWVADNGDTSWEYVHRIVRGGNAGWSAFEGSAPFRPGNVLKGPTLVHTPPIIEHSHDVMRSIIGGVFYRGSALPALHDHYIYGCYFTKRVWAASYQEGVIGEPFPIANLGHQLVGFTADPDGEILITCLDSKILRLVPNPDADTEPVELPATLSGTGLFSDTANQTLAPGVHPYQINADSWSDGATKFRAFALPPTKPWIGLLVRSGPEVRSGYRPPEGSAFLQTIAIEDNPIETQILFFDGIWRGYTYRWRDDGSDADLVPEAGADATVGSNNQPWRFSSRAECMTCHTQRTGFLISFGTRQLNCDGAGDLGNQIDWLRANKFYQEAGPRGELDKIADPHDSETDLDSRARAYLDINCAHCHREAGAGGRAAFQLMTWLTLAETGMVGAKPMVGMTGNPDTQIVRPGRPDLSELVHRMNLDIPGVRMPLLGSKVIDTAGVQLIEDWIRSLPKEE